MQIKRTEPRKIDSLNFFDGTKHRLPRYVYHGTCLSNLESVLAHGIRPRGERPSNWQEQPSRSDCVYLTADQGFGYAREHSKDNRLVVFEIKLSGLKKSLLYPDEDFVADVLAKNSHCGQSYDDLLPHVIERIEQFKSHWKDCLFAMGVVAHQGTVTTEMITRYCTVEYENRPELPTGSPLSNLWIYAAKREEKMKNTKWYFGDRKYLYPVEANRKIKGFEKRVAAWKEVSADRTGIQVVNLQ